MNIDEMEVSRVLGNISLVMSDGFHFVRMREVITGMLNDPEGDPQLQEAGWTMINQFNNLCNFVKDK